MESFSAQREPLPHDAQEQRLKELDERMRERSRQIVILKTAIANRKLPSFLEGSDTASLSVAELRERIDREEDALAELEAAYQAPTLREARAKREKGYPALFKKSGGRPEESDIPTV